MFVLALMMVSCAQMVAPSGGPKDETPAHLIRTYPSHKTPHFRSSKIILQLDEYFVLNNPSEQIVISPPLAVKPEYTINKKRLVIDLKKQALRPNTTYTINFGNAIGDLHENNLLQNLTYVFGTGANIDSFYVQGTSVNAYNNQPEKGMMAALYLKNSFTDSTPFKELPYYFSKTRPDGTFSIENIPVDAYELLVFGDANNNLKYDKNELIGFTSDSIVLGDSIAHPVRLFAYKPDPYSPGKILDTFSKEPGVFTFAAYKISAFAFAPENKKSIVWSDHYNANETDTLQVFSGETDSVFRYTYNYQDRILDGVVATRRRGKPFVFTWKVNKTVELNDTIRFSFSHPVASWDTARFRLTQDTIPIVPVYLRISPDRRYLDCYYPWQEGMAYNLLVKDSAFTSLNGRFSSGSTRMQWVCKLQKEYGSLKLNVVNTERKVVVLQLLNEAESTVYKEFQIDDSRVIVLPAVIPGKYKLKLIDDRNHNARWDNGVYAGRRSPERVYYYNEVLNLRAYWDVEQTIDINEITRDVNK